MPDCWNRYPACAIVLSRVNPAEFPSECLNPDNIWCQIFAPPQQGEARPALFLDRDGVVIEYVRYLHRAADVVLIPGAADTIAAANRLGVLVVLVTNQAGVGRGYYGWQEFLDVQGVLLAGLEDIGAHLDGVFACPHHANGTGPYAHPAHPARKPRPGMLLRAAGLLGINLDNSWIVGDASDDLAAGRSAGLRGGVLVMTGRGVTQRDAAVALSSPEFEVVVAPSIRNVTGLIPLLADL